MQLDTPNSAVYYLLVYMLTDELKTYLLSGGASLVGFGNLWEIDSSVRDNFPFGITIGVGLNPKIISEIGEGPTKAYVEECQRADILLNILGKATDQFLRQRGHKAQPRTITGPEYPDSLTTKLPHKTVATRAGLGWVGKNALLVTGEFGSAIRLGSILTNAELTVGTPIETSRCQDCTTCVDICPAQALSGKHWHVGMKRDSLVDVFTCQKTARELLMRRTGGESTGRTYCGLCIVACPWTKKYLEKSSK